MYIHRGRTQKNKKSVLELFAICIFLNIENWFPKFDGKYKKNEFCLFPDIRS